MASIYGSPTLDQAYQDMMAATEVRRALALAGKTHFEMQDAVQTANEAHNRYQRLYSEYVATWAREV